MHPPLRRALALLLLVAALLVNVLATGPVLAAPVEWREVPSRPEGRQWWDAGSLRATRAGHLSVLSRFQPAADPEQPDGRPPLGELYVMEIDCAQRLFRDVSVNGLPQFRSTWQLGSDDALIGDVIEAVCIAGAPLLPG